MPTRSRRDFLLALGGTGIAAACCGTPFRAANAQPAAGPFTVASLGDRLSQIGGAGSNVVVCDTADGLLMIDSGAPQSAQSLRTFVADRFGVKPVEILFNTHWHLEHTGGNEAVTHAGSTVIAHENTRLWMSTKFYVEWQDVRYTPRAPEALPNRTFFASDPQPIELNFGNENVLYGHLPQAHTDGDIFVWLPDRNVIVAGGAATADTFPVLDYITGGWVGGLMDATQTLIGMSDQDTLIVPESGPVRRRADLEYQHQMLETVRERVEAMALKGLGIDDMIAARVADDFADRYGNDPGLFISNMYQGMWWNHMRAI